MQSAVTTVQMDEQGRLVIPKGTRRALEIDGESATLQLDIEVQG